MIRTFKINNKIVTVEIRDEADASVANEIFKFREYRRADDVINSAKNPILDVGSHAGFFTLYARTINPKVSIISLEPEPKNCTAFQKTVSLNGLKKIELVEKALAVKNGRTNLRISADSHNHVLSAEAVEGTVAVDGITLEQIRQNFSIKTFGLVKMDIEGAEYEIIKSWKPEDFVSIENLIMEYHTGLFGRPEQIETILRENGFGVEKFPSQFDKSMGFLFATNKRLWRQEK